jgi:hypothetical protein
MSRVLIWLVAAVAGGAIGIAVLWLIATIFNPDRILPVEEPQSTVTLIDGANEPVSEDGKESGEASGEDQPR